VCRTCPCLVSTSKQSKNPFWKCSKHDTVFVIQPRDWCRELIPDSCCRVMEHIVMGQRRGAATQSSAGNEGVAQGLQPVPTPRTRREWRKAMVQDKRRRDALAGPEDVY
jgi:hypothetical protein